VWECFGGTPRLEQVGCESAECCVCPEIVEDLHEICRCQPDYNPPDRMYLPVHRVQRPVAKVCEWRCIEIEPCRFSWVRHYDCYCPSWRCDPPGPPCHLFVVGARVETPCYLTRHPQPRRLPPRRGRASGRVRLVFTALWTIHAGSLNVAAHRPNNHARLMQLIQLIQVPCNCPSPPPPPRCSDNCTWICVSSGEAGSLVWGLREFNCDAAAGCICDPPSPITCSLLGDVTSTPCYRPDQTSSTTTSGTTTTAEPCSQHVCK
jgi:hypothetical protein